MSLSPALVVALALRCAPAVDPTTMAAVVRAESGFAPLAIGVNTSPRRRISPPSQASAIRQANALIAAGQNIDLGLAQINSKNLGRLGLSVEASFDPCQNLHAAAGVLQSGFTRSDPGKIGDQAALRIAFSYYNTGRPDRGFANGYVARVTGAASSMNTPQTRPLALPAEPPIWDVFAAPSTVITFASPSTTGVLP